MPYDSVEWPARSLLGAVPSEARRELLGLGCRRGSRPGRC